MKKKWLLILVMLCITFVAAFSAAAAEPISFEQIREAMVFENMLKPCGVFCMTELDEEGNPAVSLSCGLDGERVLIQETVFEKDGTNVSILLDSSDPMGYVYSEDGCAAIYSLGKEEMLNMLLMDYTGEETVLAQVTEEDGLWHVVIEDGYRRDDMFIDQATGLVTELRMGKGIPGSSAVSVMKVAYDPALMPDETIRDRVLAYLQESRKLSFSTVDINGDPVDETMLSGARLIMVNFWEPWCGPCVREMPDLEKMYEQMKDQGLMILGVCSAVSDREEIRAIMEDIGVTYPVVIADSRLSRYTTDYVPTTVFFDGNGMLLSEEPYVGAHSRSEWEQIITEYLN